MFRHSDRFSRRQFLRSAAAAALLPSIRLRADETETLYNGIRLTDPWPPRRAAFPAGPITPPYLVDRPAIVPIDVGRQLFVDDFLIEETSLKRTFHAAQYHDRNPVLQPLTEWERYDDYAVRTKTRSNPAAMPFSDGVFYDPRERLFKMWYMGGYLQNTCYATSTDGVEWRRPSLDVVAGTNIVNVGHRDSSTVWLDLDDRDASRRYKMSRWHSHYLELFASADGIHWRQLGQTSATGDRTTFFYNPFRKVWVYSLRAEIDGSVRARRYWETPDLFARTQWKPGEPVPWTSADIADHRRPEYNVPAELYNLDCVAYESVMLGLFTIFRGEQSTREKPNDICIGFSRDGFHWDRTNREPFLGVSETVGTWNWANVQSAGGCCLVVKDRLYFYVSGRQGVPGTNLPGICSTGLAMLRRDGFASMDFSDAAERVRRIGGVAPGTLTTRPVRFSGADLFVNADLGGAEMRVEVLDVEGRVVPGFSAAACEPIRGDSTRAVVRWNGARLAALRGEPVRFRFSLTGGKIYAFWVSASPSGASQGYVGAGGPAFTGTIDDR